MLIDPNFNREPLSDYSISLGESLSKSGRHRLCRLCLREIEKKREKGDNPRPERRGRGRGRPHSPATVLAIKVGVSYDTVLRWRNPSAIQACDRNSEILAQVAFEYDPEETIDILRQDIESRRAVVENWISQRLIQAETGTPNIVASPYGKNTETKEGF